MSDFKAGVRSRHRWGSLDRAFPRSLVVFKGPTSKGRGKERAAEVEGEIFGVVSPMTGPLDTPLSQIKSNRITC